MTVLLQPPGTANPRGMVDPSPWHGDKPLELSYKCRTRSGSPALPTENCEDLTWNTARLAVPA
jgi:hypothetical protein